MPGLTYDQIKSSVFSFQKGRDATVQATDIDASINSAMNKIFREAELAAIQFEPPPLNTVVGQDFYDINASVFKILEMEITTSGIKGPLSFVSWRVYKQLKWGSQSNSIPLHWTVWENKIRLWPAPDAVYVLTMQTLKKVGGIDAIAEEFRDVVLDGALSFFDPKYIPVFEKGKQELYAYWEKERASNNQFQGDADVEAHHAATAQFNIV